MSVLFCKYSNFFLEYRVHSLCLLKLFSSFVFIQIFGFVLETRLIADWSLLKCWFWESRWYFPSIFPFKFINHSRHWIECTNAKNLKLFLDYNSFEQYTNRNTRLFTRSNNKFQTSVLRIFTNFLSNQIGKSIRHLNSHELLKNSDQFQVWKAHGFAFCFHTFMCRDDVRISNPGGQAVMRWA